MKTTDYKNDSSVVFAFLQDGGKAPRNLHRSHKPADFQMRGQSFRHVRGDNREGWTKGCANA